MSGGNTRTVCACPCAAPGSANSDVPHVLVGPAGQEAMRSLAAGRLEVAEVQRAFASELLALCEVHLQHPPAASARAQPAGRGCGGGGASNGRGASHSRGRGGRGGAAREPTRGAGEPARRAGEDDLAAGQLQADTDAEGKLDASNDGSTTSDGRGSQVRQSFPGGVL